jgi:hypothetical protein
VKMVYNFRNPLGMYHNNRHNYTQIYCIYTLTTPIHLYNYRNPLDVLLSKDKHSEVPTLRHACWKGDAKCLDKYTSVRLTLPTGERLLHQLDDMMHVRDVDLQHAAQFHVPFLSVDYAETAEGSVEGRLRSLQRVANFLGVDRQLTLQVLKFPCSHVSTFLCQYAYPPHHTHTHTHTQTHTLQDLEVGTVSTAPESQADQIANYLEVVQTLNGTKYQSLLH